MQEKFKSRKLIVSTVLFIAATVFIINGTATFKEWSDFMIWVFGIYAGGNVGEHYCKRDEKN